MDILNVKSGNEWVGIPAMQGPQGAKGDKGDKGDNGQDGFSPTVSVTSISGGQRITITDATGPHTADILNGDPSSLIAVQNTEPQGSDVQLWIDDTNAPEGIQVPTYEEHLEGLAQKAPIIIDSKSGNPIVINDGVPGLKLYDMKVSFAPKQAGTGDPSPTNIRPITGWDGVKLYKGNENFLPKPDVITNGWTSTVYGVTATFNDGYFDVVGTSSPPEGSSWASVVSFYTVYATNPIILPPGTYVMPQGLNICLKQNGQTSNKASAFTLDSNAELMGFYVAIYKETTVNYHIPLMLVIGTERPTKYIEHVCESIPISWQSEAGTVYGGELDVLTGILTITHAVVSAQKSIFGASFSVGIGYRQTPARYDKCLSGTNWNMARQTQIMSNGKIANPYSETTYGDYVGILYQIEPTETKATLRISEALYQALGDEDVVSIAYELQTPYTVQLTASQIALIAGTNTIWTDADTAEIAYPVDTKKYVDAGARDIQIKGTSILQDGIANIPISGVGRLGVVRTEGLGLSVNQNSGEIMVTKASNDQIKAGASNYAPIVPSSQHISAFYALAKLAGVDLANETVTVGQYPNPALVAIQKMLGMYQAPWEIINEETFTNESEADYIITVDRYGQPFELTEAMMLFELPKLSTGDVDSSKGNYGQIWFIYDNGNKYIAPEPGSFRRVADGDAKGSWYRIQNNNGLIISMATVPTTNTNSGTLRLRYIQNGWSGMGVFVDDGTFAITSVNIRGVTGNGKYRLYGRRKWT